MKIEVEIKVEVNQDKKEMHWIKRRTLRTCIYQEAWLSWQIYIFEIIEEKKCIIVYSPKSVVFQKLGVN